MHPDPDRDRDGERLALVVNDRLGRTTNSLRERTRLHELDVRHDDEELLAAVARDEIGPRDVRSQDRGGASDREVARGQSELIVDSLQVIEIDHHHDPGRDPIELAIGGRALEHSRQRIDHVLDMPELVEHAPAITGKEAQPPAELIGGRDRLAVAQRLIAKEPLVVDQHWHLPGLDPPRTVALRDHGRGLGDVEEDAVVAPTEGEPASEVEQLARGSSGLAEQHGHPSDDIGSAVATREQLEAQIEADPTDDSAYEILGDLLQLEGDPRGELIGLDAAYLRGGDHLAWARRRAELLDQHLELQPRTGSTIHYRWHLGFIRRISLGSSLNYLAIFGHPSLRFATELVMLEPEGTALMDVLVGACQHMPLLRALAIGDPDEPHYRSTASYDGGALKLDHFVDLSALRQLYSCQPIQLGHLPRLEWLRLEGDADAFQRLREAELPALQKLAVNHGHTSPIQIVRWMIQRPPPALVDLELTDADADVLIPALIGSPLLQQLRVLRLWNANVTADTARLITRTAFGHLDLLDLSDPLLDDATIAQVSGACREVRTISPWMREILKRPG